MLQDAVHVLVRLNMGRPLATHRSTIRHGVAMSEEDTVLGRLFPQRVEGVMASQFVASTGIDVDRWVHPNQGPGRSEAGCLAQVSQTPANGKRHFTRPGEPRDKVNVPITSFVSVSRTVSTIVVPVTDPTYAAG